MKMTDADERALAVMQFARGYLTWNNMQEHDDALQHIRARLAATQEAKPNIQQKGGGEAAAGLVSGYLPTSRCVEIKLDGPIPDWVKELPKRAYLTSTAELEAVGRSGEGHNADWCAGWNAHNLIMSAPQPSIPAPAQRADEVHADALRIIDRDWFDYVDGPPTQQEVGDVEAVEFRAAFFVSKDGNRVEQLTSYEDYRSGGAILRLMDLGQKRASAKKLTKKGGGKVVLSWIGAALAHPPHAEQETQG